MENSEKLAQPQRRLEKHAVFIFQVVFSTLSGFCTTIAFLKRILLPITLIKNARSPFPHAH